MKNIYTLFLLLILGGTQLFAQVLPHHMTKEEAKQMPEYLQQATTQRATSEPPPGPVRTMAEWEEIQGFVIAWAGFSTILTEIVRNAVEETTVYIVCDNPNQVTNVLTNANVSMDNVILVEGEYDSIWIRDYGPWSAYLEEVGELVQIDWLYNRPRPLDDVVPALLANQLELPLYETNAEPNALINTGGNFMVDGLGTAFSSELILDENDGNGWYEIFYPDHTEEEIDGILEEYMGIDRYIKMPVLPYDAIHHIDMHMKLLDEETILVGEYPEGVADGPQIEANITYIQDNFMSAFGTPYKIVRIPMPPAFNGNYPNSNGDYRTYTNNVFINKTVLVPTYEEEYDTVGLRILRENLPGYNVVGINCNNIIPLSGALHCITKAIGTDDPLLIVHQAVSSVDPEEDTEPVLFEATVKHISGIDEVNLMYKNELEDGPFASLAMDLIDEENDTWSAELPIEMFEGNDDIQYYIDATATSGKQQVRPMTAPEGFWTIKVGEDEIVTPPVSIQEANNLQMEAIYPNPSKGITVIPVNTPQAVNGSLILQDLAGRTIRNIHQGAFQAGKQNYFLDTTEMTAGAYFVQWNTNTGSQTQKLIIR